MKVAEDFRIVGIVFPKSGGQVASVTKEHGAITLNVRESPRGKVHQVRLNKTEARKLAGFLGIGADLIGAK